MPLRLKFLLFASVVLCGLMLLGYVFASYATFDHTIVEVRGPSGEGIGYANIPYDYDGGILLAFAFAALSGLQLWTVWEVVRLSRIQKRIEGNTPGELS